MIFPFTKYEISSLPPIVPKGKPINSKKDVTKFYNDIDSQWADDANYVNVIVMESLKIDNLQHLQDVADKLLEQDKD